MTAVEFIRQEFLEKITNENYKKSFDQIIEQAKEMEKEQREIDFSAGNDSACMEHEDIKDYFDKYIKSAKEAYEFGQKTMYCGCYAIEDAMTYEEWVLQNHELNKSE